MYGQLSIEELDHDHWPAQTPERIHHIISDIRARAPSLDVLRENFEQAMQYLQENSRLKVIHLRRRNRLHTLVSTVCAFQEDNWMNLPYETQQIQLQPEQCEVFFRETGYMEMHYSKLYADCPAIDIYYGTCAETHN